MASIRYSARQPEEVRNREVEATTSLIWSQAVTAVFETDLDLIASVLPQPLEPSSPTARLRFAVVDMGTGLKPFGAGWFGVRARHGDVEGEYALFMPMTTEQATIGGRETFGEPKKIGDVSLAVDGDHLTAEMGRMGFTVATVEGALGAETDGYEIDKLDFYFKLSPSPDGDGLDSDPAFVYTRRHEIARSVRPITGELKLLESPLDPISDFPVRKLLSLDYAEIASTQVGEVVDHVPASWLLPFVHQKFDDLSVLGAK
jgi:acetoacetate decarboxylase